MKLKIILTVILLLPIYSFAAPPTGDTQGKLSAVRILNSTDGNNSFRLYYSKIDNDRWQCLQNNGYITVRDNGVGVTTESYKQIYSMALTALASGKTLALDSSGTSPCENVNSGMILSN